MASLTFEIIPGTQLYTADCGASTGQVGQDFPQTLYLLPAGTANPPSSIPLEDSWTKYSGTYIFIDEQLSDPATFAAIAQKYLSAQPQVTRFAWISNPNDLVLNAVTIVVDSQQNTRLVQTFNFRNDIVVVGQGCPITLDLDNNQFAIAQPGSDPNRIAFQVDFGNTTLTGALGAAVYIPLCQDQSGCLRFQLTVGEADLAGDRLDAALRYFVDDPNSPFPGALTSQRYPILSLSEAGIPTKVALTANLDPLDALNTARSYFSFTESPSGGGPSTGSPVGSYYRTKTGAEVTITPLASARFVFAPNPSALEPSDSDPLYLVPMGDFVLGADSGAQQSAAKSGAGSGVAGAQNVSEGSRLMAGFGGNEYFDLLDSSGGGNAISFSPGQNAYVPGLGTSNGNGNGSGNARVSLEPGATTSWAVVQPSPVQQAEGEVTYYAQPQTSELYSSGFPFAGSGSSSVKVGDLEASVLGFLEVPAVQSTSTTLPPPVPVTPYAGIQPDIDDSVGTARQIEVKALSPYRRATLGFAGPSSSALRAAAEAETAPEPNSTTPQGLLSSVAGSVMNSLLLGQDDVGNQLQINVAGTSELQGALQTNQQFIIVTAVDVLKFFGSSISIGGWTFDFTIPTGGTPPAGGYSNVLIIKFYKDSISNLATNTAAWTNGDTFNKDVDAVSKWLTGYIEDAEKSLADGTTQFQSFVDLVKDPNWNGIIGLNVYIPPGALPSEVQGLLGGIDLSKFSAHHFGVATNSISGFSLTKSSLFALINYDNTGASVAAASESVGDSTDPAKNFIVRTLQVVFDNSEITGFNAEIEVTIENLFGVPASRDGESLAAFAENDPCNSGNTIRLAGSYENHDGESTYSFASTCPYIFDLSSGSDLDIIQQVKFDKVQFTTVASTSNSGQTLITSTFSFWGNLKFGKLLDFDFFSFDDLAFADLSIAFTFDPSKLGTGNIPIQSFSFDPGNLRFDLSISKERQDSLLGNFPLRLTGFTFATEGVLVSDLGYVQITSPFNNLDGPVMFALTFQLDLGSIGGLPSPLKGFAADILAGWNPNQPGKVALGIKMPESSGGKIQVGIEGVLLLTIENFEFTTLPASDSKSDPVPKRYVLYMRNCTLDVLGVTVPPGGNAFSFVFFAPIGGSINSTISNLGWFVAIAPTSSESKALTSGSKSIATGKKALAAPQANGNGGSGSIFKLSYLGLGQRVAVPGGFDDVNTVSEALKAIADGLTPNKTGKELNDQLSQIYDPNRNWVVGAEFTILETLTLGGVFYDPSLYGLLVGIASGKLGPLGGFNIEILYKKVTDTIGVYQIQLTLPDALRQLQFGSVSITIPVIGIDIYTNGNFKVDVGFPKGTDFSNSLTVQVFPFIGAGGFYYAQLSQGTATNVTPPPVGTFNPVMEFGFGLSLGLGKTINMGLLKAGLTVTFVGILEGTVAYWVPPGQQSSGAAVAFNQAPDFYIVTGQLALVGTLYGVVDFGIVKASLTITLSAGITINWEAYKSFQLGVYAKVSVKLTVVIGGFRIFGIKIEIKISFSFSAEISYTWTIADNRTPPWAHLTAGGARMFAVMAPEPSEPIDWNPIKIYDALPITLLFSPQVTVAPTGTSSTAQAQFVALLTVSTSSGSSSPSDFDNLGSAILGWALNQFLSPGATTYNPNQTVTEDDVNNLINLLATPGTTVNDGPVPLNYANIGAFLVQNFKATIGAVPTSGAPQSTTVFPMIPNLTLSATGQDNIYFDSHASKPDSYLVDIERYFALLLVNFDAAQGGLQAAADSNMLSMATIIFQDYSALVVQAALSQALSYIKSLDPSEPPTIGTLLSGMQQAGLFVQVAGQAGRFLLNGLRLPPEFKGSESDWPNLPTSPLYQLDGQQVPLTPISTASSVSDTAPTANTFKAAAGLSSADGFYIGYSITFVTGNLSGQTSNVSAYAGATEMITVSPAFSQAPANGDQFVLTANASSAVNDNADTTTTFKGTIGLSTVDGSYNRYEVVFTSGTLAGQVSTVTAYAGSSLQFTVSPAFSAAPANGDKFVVTPFVAELSINQSATPQAWVQIDAANPPTSAMEADTFGTILALEQTDFKPKITVSQLPNLALKPKMFSLQRTIAWQQVGAGAQNWTLYPFPPTLMDQLANTLQPLPQLTLLSGDVPAGTDPIVPPGLQYNWALTASLSVMQIPSAGGLFLPNTYQVGGADETARDLIFSLLNSPNVSQIDSMYILFAPQSSGGSGLSSQTTLDPNATMLMRVNLSTESAPPPTAVPELLAAVAVPPPDDFTALLSQPSDFLKLVWEASIVNAGGYYFYYKTTDASNNGLPSYLFESGTTAQITLVVTFKSGVAVGNYNNAVVVTNPSDPISQFFAQASNIQVWNPTIAAGSVGFDLTVGDPSASYSMPEGLNASFAAGAGLTRDNVISALAAQGIGRDHPEFSAKMAEANDDAIQLMTLFNLLTYKIEGNATFNTSIQGLPVGPTDPADGDGTVDDTAATTTTFKAAAGLSSEDGFYVGSNITFTTGANAGQIRSISAYTGATEQITVSQAFPQVPANGDAFSITATTWDYEQGVSVFNWYKTSDGSTNESPYVGIGNQVRVEFQLLDLFGNEMPTTEVFPVLNADYLYFDDLIPVTTWPGLAASYLCSLKGGSSVLEVALIFQGSSFQDTASSAVETATSGSEFIGGPELSATDDFYKGWTILFTSGALMGQSSTVTAYNGSTRLITVSPAFVQAPAPTDQFTLLQWSVERAGQALEQYNLIGYQLTGPGVSIDVTTSLAVKVTTPVDVNLFVGAGGLVTGIKAFLAAIVAGDQNPAAPDPVVISEPITLAMREANANNIFEVTVTLAVARDPKLVDPKVNTVQAGQAPSLALMAASPIQPQVGNPVSSEVTGSPSSSSFQGGPDLSVTDDFYTGGILTFTSGVLNGQTSTVTAYIGATRTITVSPAFGVAPAIGDTFDVTPKGTLLPFAESFEDAFTELRAAVGLGSAGPRSIWAARVGIIQPGNEGITVQINTDNPTFYAPKPLSTTLLSRNGVEVIPYVSGGPDPKPISANFAGVDMDVWGRNFLTAVDQFLSPGFAVPARQISPDDYLAVITAKQSLAEQISFGVTNVLEALSAVTGSPTSSTFQGGQELADTDNSYLGFSVTFTSGKLTGSTSKISGYIGATRTITVNPALPSAPAVGDSFRIDPSAEALEEAQQAFTQRLLVTLASNYQVSTIVQHPADVSVSGVEEAIPPNLYGQVVETQIEGKVVDAQPTAQSFTGDQELASSDGFYNGSTVLFTSGALAKQQSTIVNYVGATREITVSLAFSSAPANGDAFQIIQPNFALSTSKVSLDPKGGRITFLFDSTIVAQAAIPLDMQFKVTHIEHDIAEHSQFGGFTSSSWLTLLTSKTAEWPNGSYLTVGRDDIPVPLRAYPTPPSLLSQNALPGPTLIPEPGTGSVTLASQRLWHYTYQYQQGYIAQDTVGADIIYNQPQQQNLRAMAAGEPDLFDWLARFTIEYPQMQPDLSQLPIDPSNKNLPYAIHRFAQLVWGAAFGLTPLPSNGVLPLVPPPDQGIWAQWVLGEQGGGQNNVLRGSLGDGSLTLREDAYQVQEINPTNTTGSSIVLTAEDAGAPFPEIAIQIVSSTVAGSATTTSFEGGVALVQEAGAYVDDMLTFTTGASAGTTVKVTAYDSATRTLTFAPALSQAPAQGDAFTLSSVVEAESGSDQNSATYDYTNPNASTTLVRTFSFDNLDVMTTENAWGGIQLSRNLILVQNIETNPEFIYQTPLVRFVNVVTPNLDSDAPVDIADIPPGGTGQELEYYLCLMFKALFAPSGSGEGQTPTGLRTIRVGCSYGYDVRGNAKPECSADPERKDAVIVSLPVLLIPPFQLDLSEFSGSCGNSPDPGSFVSVLGSRIRDWFKALSPSTACALFVFDVSVFAGLSQTNLPVLRLRNLFLNYSDIKPLN